MAVTRQAVLRVLADGAEHSGADLARSLGVTRAAVWKVIRACRDDGVAIEAVRGRGYRLAAPLDLLGTAPIRAGLKPAVADRLDALELHWSLASTSDHLLGLEPPVAPGRARVCLTEFQTGGRGRRGRRWVAAFGESLCLSLAWSFAASPTQLGTLGMVAGVGVWRALRAAGCTDAALKWPNDVVIGGRKLAGILIDVRGEAGGPLQAVVGVGVNHRLSPATRAGVAAARDPALQADSLSPADLHGCGVAIDRNALAACLIGELIDTLLTFDAQGFGALVDVWREADYLHGQPVTVHTDSGVLAGVARGIAADGRLQVTTDRGIMHVLTGDVSVRPA
jgi:BirA family biotin operon repressor/biotin-[acetyl-CoA-carboxylase] ligase